MGSEEKGAGAWQIAVEPRAGAQDSLGTRIHREIRRLGFPATSVRSARLFFVEGPIDREQAQRLASELLADAVCEDGVCHFWADYDGSREGSVTVRRKAGVMDPWVDSIRRGAHHLGLELGRIRSATRYDVDGLDAESRLRLGRSALANEAIEEIQIDDDRFPAIGPRPLHSAERIEVPLRELDAESLDLVSQEGQLSLKRYEMEAIQEHFRKLGREPTEVELETIAQTWSEHCKHKVFTSPINYKGSAIGSLEAETTIRSLLKETIKDATVQIDSPLCLSVFHDNAGVISFEGDQALCFKVETHNHPSAIEPYGGAGTGIGGVIRDILGTGRGARPIANSDVFCVGPLDLDPADLPKGALPPLRVLRGVVSGVRDYGNQMGIPTVSGGVFFDERYVGNPLVYAGTVGILPEDAVHKSVEPGDVIVAIGGRTGRDGIHGATFSSVSLHDESEEEDAGAVQIGNAIQEKKVLDVLLQARDRNLFRGVTDCGAGGFSSAVGEMGAECGARVQLENAPLKYEGLSPTEIWISEAQERMVFAVPPEQLDELLALCEAEDVEAVSLGHFTDTGRLEIRYGDVLVADLENEFLHDGLPLREREASWNEPEAEEAWLPEDEDASQLVLRLLAMPNVASKEWIIRQYDHEVQSGSAVKPLVGTEGQGPSDAAVVAPILGNDVGVAISSGMNPCYGDLDPYAMAEAAVDEALRNAVSVGGDPDHCAILDNFSWGNPDRPESLGALVRACFGCRDAALALRTPFISGKDSLNNEFRVENADGSSRSISIPHTLLVSAIARVPDVRDCVTMDLKAAGNALYVVGSTDAELGGSHLLRLFGRRGVQAPRLDGARARKTFQALHQAIKGGLVRSCHDLSEGGLAVAAGEMVLAGGLGAKLSLDALPTSGPLHDLELLFSESLSRFLVEVPEEQAPAFEATLAGVPMARIGATSAEPVLSITRGDRELVRCDAHAMEAAFRGTLTPILDGESEDHG